MAWAGRWARMVAGGVVAATLMLAGCQEQRTQVPATSGGSVDSMPAAVSSPKTPSAEPALQTSNFKPQTPQEPPEGGTPNESKRAPAKAEKPEPSGPAVELTLKFVPGQGGTYKFTAESYKSVEWKGAPAAKPAQFTDGRTGSHVELTFEQRVVQVQDDGNAVLEVTIRGLKETIESVNKVVLDFDSARPADSNQPMAALIGGSYRVTMSPEGRVVAISDVEPLRRAVQGNQPQQRVAARLLSDDEIRNRHEIVALSALKGRQVRPGQTWSSVKNVSFDELGAKTYERVYTLKQAGGAVRTFADDRDERGQTAEGEGVHGTPYAAGNSGDRLAVVEMKAIPLGAGAGGQRANPFGGMSDSSDSFQGRLVLDLDRGQVREYVEQMQNEWIIADPTSAENGPPAALRMAASRLHRLELVP